MASMNVNQNTVMYGLKPYYNTSEILETPECMYKLKRIYNNASDMVTTSDVPDEVAQLESRQEAILQRLEHLKVEVEKLSKTQKVTAVSTTGTSQQQTVVSTGSIQDLVVNANSSNPPLSLVVLKNILSKYCKVLGATFVHSSANNVPDVLKSLFPTNNGIMNRADYQFAFTVIWKDDKYGSSLMVSPSTQSVVYGESNIARYVSRLLSPSYDSDDIIAATQIDNGLDLATQLLQGSNKERAAVLRTLNASLGKSKFVVGNELSLADIVLWSALQQNKMTQAVPGNVKKWLEVCNEIDVFEDALKIANAL